jgi:hypothetical protein
MPELGRREDPLVLVCAETIGVVFHTFVFYTRYGPQSGLHTYSKKALHYSDNFVISSDREPMT